LNGDTVVEYGLQPPVTAAKPLDFKTKPKTYFLQTAATSRRSAATLIKAGSHLYVGCAGSVAVYAAPLKPGQAPERELAVNGKVGYLAAGGGRLLAVTDDGRVHCFGAQSAVPSATQRPQPAGRDAATAGAAAREILADAKCDAGWVVVAGAGGLDLAADVVQQTRAQVVLLERDAAAVDAARLSLIARGLYGERLALIAGDLKTTPLPPYFARLVVSTESAGTDRPTLDAVYRALHPYQGVAYFAASRDQHAAIVAFATAQGTYASATRFNTMSRLARLNGLAGAGNWTHEHGDAANTRVAKDTLVKAPLGLLWYGGPGHEKILPRHGHGPQPQTLDGRLVIQGMDMLRALDIYTGNLLWQTPLPGVGSYYNNLSHHPGANGTGTNFISTPEGIYVTLGRACLRLDPATGKQTGEHELPSDAPANAIWGYLNVVGGHLVGGVAMPTKPLDIAVTKTTKKVTDEDDDDDDTTAHAPGVATEVPRAVSSRRLFILDRASGKLLWSVAAQSEFRHNSVCAGDGKLFALDRPTRALVSQRPVEKAPEKTTGKGEATAADKAADRTVEKAAEKPADKVNEKDMAPGTLRAFDLATGKELWRCDEAVVGTWLAYSEEHDVLVASGRNTRDNLMDETKGMRAFQGKDGTPLWTDPKGLGPPMLRGTMVLREKNACDLLTGKPVTYTDPITGKPQTWTWTRMYGCNTPAAAQHLITFRSGAAGYYDLARMGGTGNFGGFRSSCTHNLVVAGGIICAPDYTRTCACSYQIQTSVALVPDPVAEMWTFSGATSEVKDPIVRLGLNLGAPGDRVTDDGTLWLEYPSTGAPMPKLSIKADPEKIETFRLHSSLVAGPMNWVAASGVKDLRQLSLKTNSKTTQPFTVRLYFAEPDALKTGERVFDVRLQGQTVLRGFDIVAQAGGPRRALVKEFRDVKVDAELTVELNPSAPGSVPVLCGIELIAQ
jgi:outer membrane protein assembly factor BamB